MQLLLDTHAFLWWTGDDAALGPVARAAIADGDNIIFVSAASVWEIATKRANGKLEAPGDIADWVSRDGFTELAIDSRHAVRSAELPLHHRDPFDRLLIAQAQLEDLTLVTNDSEVLEYEVEILDAGA